MKRNKKGQVIIPTGGGKTMCMIYDALRSLNTNSNSTMVVVAPRILLANQLCEEFMQFLKADWVHVYHVHSGETHYESGTKPDKLAQFIKDNRAKSAVATNIIFTTISFFA